MKNHHFLEKRMPDWSLLWYFVYVLNIPCRRVSESVKSWEQGYILELLSSKNKKMPTVGLWRLPKRLLHKLPLTHLLLMHLSLPPESTRKPVLRGVRKGCIGNKWVKMKIKNSSVFLCKNSNHFQAFSIYEVFFSWNIVGHYAFFYKQPCC